VEICVVRCDVLYIQYLLIYRFYDLKFQIFFLISFERRLEVVTSEQEVEKTRCMGLLFKKIRERTAKKYIGARNHSFVLYSQVWESLEMVFLNFASAVVAAVAVVAVYLGGVGGLAENERKISADPS
jgi:hypothetical protein